MPPDRFTRWLARHRTRPSVRAGAKLALRYLRGFENFDYDMEHNGEIRVLRRAALNRPTVVFDVGANTGQWSLRAAELAPQAAIHSFEIVPSTALKLGERCAMNARIVVNGFGLSDATRVVKVNVPAPCSPLSSTVGVVLRAGGDWLDGRVRRGDEYATSVGISHIDLLKIDVEGAEDLVLRGFNGLLSSKSIDAIQFEYGLVAIRTKFLLADFYDLFSGYGYVVGKIYPREVAFKPYHLEAEDLHGPNFLAVPQDRPDLIRLFS